MNLKYSAVFIVTLLWVSCTSLPRVAQVKIPTAVPFEKETHVEILPQIDLPHRIGQKAPSSPVSTGSLKEDFLKPVVQADIPQPKIAQAIPQTPKSANADLTASPHKPNSQLSSDPLKTVGQEAKTASGSVKPSPKPTPIPSPAKPTALSTTVQPAASPLWQVPVPISTSPSPSQTPSTQNSILPSNVKSSADIKWEEINAKVGDDVYIQFNKLNWIFLEPKEASQKAGFIESRREANGTSFLFRPKLLGTFELEFQRQDLATGSTETRKVRLTTYDPNSRLADASALNPQLTTNPKGNFFDQTQPLVANGQTPQAVQKLLQNYKPEDTKLNLQIAQLLTQSQQGLEALKYLDRNLTRTSNEFIDSLSLATETASSLDKSRLNKYLQLWLDTKKAPAESLYFQALDALVGNSVAPIVSDWLDVYSLWYPVPQERDRYLFLKAKYLESAGPQRNVQSAWELYQQIVSEYPLSDYWSLAGERASYLKRHFLQAR